MLNSHNFLHPIVFYHFCIIKIHLIIHQIHQMHLNITRSWQQRLDSMHGSSLLDANWVKSNVKATFLDYFPALQMNRKSLMFTFDSLSGPSRHASSLLLTRV